MIDLWNIVHMACVLMLPVMVPLAALLFFRNVRRRGRDNGRTA